MARVILLLCALLIGTLISQGEGCKPPKWVRVGGKWIKRVAGREVTFGDREGYKLNYSEMLDGIKHPGLMSALKAYDTNKDGIISGEENTVMIEKATMVFYDSDADENGQLNDKELQGFVQDMTNLKVDKVFNEQEQKQMFADLDVDGNGALTQDEMKEPTVVEDILKVFVTSESG